MSDTTNRKEAIPIAHLIPEVRHVNARPLFAQIVPESQTWLRHWIGLCMSHLLDKAVDDLLGRERNERRAQVGYHIEAANVAVVTHARVVSSVGILTVKLNLAG